jgi:hypothetical protein
MSHSIQFHVDEHLKTLQLRKATESALLPFWVAQSLLTPNPPATGSPRPAALWLTTDSESYQ